MMPVKNAAGDIKEKLILGLDIDDAAAAYSLIDKLSPHIKFFKVGLQLITKDGPRLVMTLKRKGLKVFYDAKFYDIPQTVYNACYEATRLGVNMVNVHASGGPKMISYARNAIEDASSKLQVEKPLLLAVTVLTSFENRDLKNVLKSRMQVKEMVLHLAKMAKKAGADGVVCSPHEIRTIKKELGKDFVVVTPGVRMGKVEKDDQKRIMTPYEAIKNGADYIVVARPILQAEDKLDMIEKIIKQIQEGSRK
ncbi:MAG TPA: orotidine-5'-phosphate decarboxylase [Candidatus Goldiibacteriota bacterium]|nr:orotidine-5'-phosphate decarboxylase [Candidatus Goldiibacteriota bacterium]